MRRFEFTQDGSSKFWEVATEGSALTVRFGKMGTSGQTNVKTFASPEAAQKEARRLIAEKTKKGYLETSQGPSTEPQTASSSRESSEKLPASEKEGASKPTASQIAESLTRTFAELDRALSLEASTEEVVCDPLTKLLGREPHAELQALWRWGHASEVLEHELLTVARVEHEDYWWWGAERWLSPRHAAEDLVMLREMIPSFPKTLVPIADDGAGNLTCHDFETASLFDWDHETQEVSRRSGNLQNIFETLLKLIAAERRSREKQAKEVSAAAKRRAAAALRGGGASALPKKLRHRPSQILRSVNAHHKDYGFSGAAMTADGSLLVGWVSGSGELAFVDVERGKKELVPQEPELVAYASKMGFPKEMRATGITTDGERFVWLGDRRSGELTSWVWKDGALTMERGAAVKFAPFCDKTQPRLRGPWLATMHYDTQKEEVSIGLWSVDDLPRATTFEEAKRQEIAPKAVHRWPYKGFDLFLDVDARGNVFFARTPEYNEWILTHWEAAAGGHAREIKLSDIRIGAVAVTADGERLFVLTDEREDEEGGLRIYDRHLTLERRLPAYGRGWTPNGLWFSPNEDVFVTCASHFEEDPELWVWNAKTLEVLVKTKSKNKSVTLVHGIAGSTVLTTDPLTLYELS